MRAADGVDAGRLKGSKNPCPTRQSVARQTCYITTHRDSIVTVSSLEQFCVVFKGFNARLQRSLETVESLRATDSCSSNILKRCSQ